MKVLRDIVDFKTYTMVFHTMFASNIKRVAVWGGTKVRKYV